MAVNRAKNAQLAAVLVSFAAFTFTYSIYKMKQSVGGSDFPDTPAKLGGK
jgi:hypothetical protein